MLKSLQYPINFYIGRSLKTLKIIVSNHDRILVLANTRKYSVLVFGSSIWTDTK